MDIRACAVSDCDSEVTQTCEQTVRLYVQLHAAYVWEDRNLVRKLDRIRVCPNWSGCHQKWAVRLILVAQHEACWRLSR
jgi:hypothetical protein